MVGDFWGILVPQTWTPVKKQNENNTISLFYNLIGFQWKFTFESHVLIVLTLFYLIVSQRCIIMYIEVMICNLFKI